MTDPLSVYLDFCEKARVTKFRWKGFSSIAETFGHTCDPRTCVFYEHKASDSFVCYRSGKIHQCGPDHCNQYVITREHTVCPLTARCWELMDYDTVTEVFKGTHSVSRDTLQQEAVNEEVQHAPVTHDLYDVDNEQKNHEREAEDLLREKQAWEIIQHLCLSDARATLDAGNKRSKEKQIDAAFRQHITQRKLQGKPICLFTLMCLYWTELNRVPRSRGVRPRYGNCLPSERAPPSPPSLIARLQTYAKECVLWWNRLKPQFDLVPRYRFDYHCLALLYQMQKGIRNHEQVYLETDEFLCGLLPSIQHLHVLGYTKRLFTTHDQCIRVMIVSHFRPTVAAQLQMPLRKKRKLGNL